MDAKEEVKDKNGKEEEGRGAEDQDDDEEEEYVFAEEEEEEEEDIEEDKEQQDHHKDDKAEHHVQGHPFQDVIVPPEAVHKKDGKITVRLQHCTSSTADRPRKSTPGTTVSAGQ